MRPASTQAEHINGDASQADHLVLALENTKVKTHGP
jgi:hypothetical protein